MDGAEKRPTTPTWRRSGARPRVGSRWPNPNGTTLNASCPGAPGLCNRYFRTRAASWKAAGDDPRLIHTRVAMRFVRIAFHIVAGRQVFQHPATRERSYILEKPIAFHREHDTPLNQVLADLDAAVTQLPASAQAAEAAPLVRELEAIRSGRRRGPQPVGDVRRLENWTVCVLNRAS